MCWASGSSSFPPTFGKDGQWSSSGCFCRQTNSNSFLLTVSKSRSSKTSCFADQLLINLFVYFAFAKLTGDTPDFGYFGPRRCAVPSHRPRGKAITTMRVRGKALPLASGLGCWQMPQSTAGWFTKSSAGSHGLKIWTSCVPPNLCAYSSIQMTRVRLSGAGFADAFARKASCTYLLRKICSLEQTFVGLPRILPPFDIILLQTKSTRLSIFVSPLFAGWDHRGKTLRGLS